METSIPTETMASSSIHMDIDRLNPFFFFSMNKPVIEKNSTLYNPPVKKLDHGSTNTTNKQNTLTEPASQKGMTEGDNTRTIKYCINQQPNKTQPTNG